MNPPYSQPPPAGPSQGSYQQGFPQFTGAGGGGGWQQQNASYNQLRYRNPGLVGGNPSPSTAHPPSQQHFSHLQQQYSNPIQRSTSQTSMAVPQHHNIQHNPFAQSQQSSQQHIPLAAQHAAHQHQQQFAGPPSAAQHPPGVPVASPMASSIPEARRAMLVGKTNIGGLDESFAGAKRALPTDRTLPSFLPSNSTSPSSGSSSPTEGTLASLSASYAKLQKLEGKLDWTLTRKKVELEETLGMGRNRAKERVGSVKRKFRVLISHTTSSQPWQVSLEDEAKKAEEIAKDAAGTSEAGRSGSDNTMKEGEENSKEAGREGSKGSDEKGKEKESEPTRVGDVNFDSGAGIPKWTLKVEGWVLKSDFETESGVQIRETLPRFSELVKQVKVEQESEGGTTLDHVAEWKLPTPPAPLPPNYAPPTPLDGLDVTRPSSTSTPIDLKVSLYLTQQPERFQIRPELGRLLDLKEETQLGVVNAIWSYVKRERLQDVNDKRVIRCDKALSELFGITGGIHFRQLMELVRRFMYQPEPVVLDYTIRLEKGAESKPVAYDIDVEIEDPAKAQMIHVLQKLSAPSEELKEIMELDAKITQTVTLVKSSKLKRDFLTAFASDPHSFIQDWLASQSHDLHTVLGGQNLGDGRWRTEDLRSSEFFRGPGKDWVREGIKLHQTRLANGKMMKR